MGSEMFITKRQFITETVPQDGSGWYSPTAYVVKWSVLLALFVTFFLWIVIGYYHARRRVKAGLPPLVYHRWLVPRSQRYPQSPQPQNTFAYYQQNNHGMQETVDPPPAYSNADMPPKYQMAVIRNKSEITRSSQQTSRQELPIEIQERSRTTG